MPSRDQFTTEIYVNNQQAQDALMELNQKLEKLQKSYANLNKNSKNYEQRERELAKQIKATEASIATAEKGTESYARAMNNLGKRSIEQLYKLQRQLNSEIRKLDPNDAEFAQLSKNYQTVTQRIHALEEAQKGVLASQGGFFKRMTVGLSKYYGAIMIGIGVVKRFAQSFMDAYRTISNFEQANATLASILGETSTNMDKLEKSAIKLGSSTSFTSTQVTELQTELAKLGFTSDQIMGMQKSVLNFAKAVRTDLASAAALSGVALRTFNLSADEAEDALGTMAIATNKSALSFTYLENAFSTVAPVAKTYGLSLKDTIALLGTLANAGFDASSAATATRNILLNLADTNGKLAKSLGGSVNTFDDIIQALIKLRDGGVNLNETLELTDKRSVAAFNSFLDGAESARTLRVDIEDVNGELQRMSDQIGDTVEGSILSLQSAWEGFVLSFRSSKGKIKDVIDFLTNGVQGLRRLIDPEGTTVAEYAEIYSNQFRGMRNEFNTVFDQRDRMEKQYQSMKESLAKQDTKLNRQKAQALEQAYQQIMEETAVEAEAIEKRILEINAEYFQKKQEIQKRGLGITDGKEFNKIVTVPLAELDKEWNEAIALARRGGEAIEEVEAQTSETRKQLSDEELAALKKEYGEKIGIVDAQTNYELKALKVQLMQQEITQEEYETEMFDIKFRAIDRKLDLAKKYNQDETKIVADELDLQVEVMELAQKKIEAIGKENDEKLKKQDDEIKRQQEELEKLMKEAESIKQSLLSPDEKRNYEENVELENLKKLHDAKLLSEEEYEKAVQAVHDKYKQQQLDDDLGNLKGYFEKANKVIEGVSGFVSQLQSAETANLEAEYQARLTAAGDNAEKREAIEAEYEQKKLDLQKKYANADMVIQIAQATASAAAACVKAWEEAKGNPYLAATLIGLITASTGAQIATIIAQRNAIMNTTASGGNGGSGNAGYRVLNEGYAKGGFTEGHTTITTVGERGTEWVAPHWMVRQNPVTFANLERYRKSGSFGRSGSVGHGFADGGFTNGTDAIQMNFGRDNAVMERLAAILERLEANGISATVDYPQLKRFEQKDQSYRKEISR